MLGGKWRRGEEDLGSSNKVTRQLGRTSAYSSTPTTSAVLPEAAAVLSSLYIPPRRRLLISMIITKLFEALLPHRIVSQ